MEWYRRNCLESVLLQEYILQNLQLANDSAVAPNEKWRKKRPFIKKNMWYDRIEIRKKKSLFQKEVHQRGGPLLL